MNYRIQNPNTMLTGRNINMKGDSIKNKGVGGCDDITTEMIKRIKI